MIRYKNNSNTTKTFYGVKFLPGEIKSVPGIINHSKFIRVNSVPVEPLKRTTSANKPQKVNEPDKSGKPVSKKEDKPAAKGSGEKRSESKEAKPDKSAAESSSRDESKKDEVKSDDKVKESKDVSSSQSAEKADKGGK